MRGVADITLRFEPGKFIGRLTGNTGIYKYHRLSVRQILGMFDLQLKVGQYLSLRQWIIDEMFVDIRPNVIVTTRRIPPGKNQKWLYDPIDRRFS